MITLDQIQAFSQQIADKFQPDRIILFGSYAYGQPTPDSDVDLLVILPFEELPVHKAIEIRRAVKSPFSLDLMARTAEQIQQRLDMGDFFIQDIVQKGRVLYEASAPTLMRSVSTVSNVPKNTSRLASRKLMSPSVKRMISVSCWIYVCRSSRVGPVLARLSMR